MVFQFRPTVHDAGPALKQHWISVLCAMGMQGIDADSSCTNPQHKQARAGTDPDFRRVIGRDGHLHQSLA